jgi:CBS domain-containing protein
MGEQDVLKALDAEQRRLFTKKLLADLRALEILLDQGAIESGRNRMGAEQELFLVDSGWHPAPVALGVLAAIADPHFTTELGLFNLEFNLDPMEMGGDSLSRLETELARLFALAREGARRQGAEAVMVGILPTLDKSDLKLENMTPRPRYYALNEALSRLRGEEYQFRIKGRDELLLRHGNMMLEACNTSFQVHLQVSPGEFTRLYNVAQAVAAPALACAVNSPLLFGRRLWRETRIALFQQSVDTRRVTATEIRETAPRVSFGQHWVRGSVLEIFQEDIARFPVLIAGDVEEDPLAELAHGRIPRLQALRLHNGTVYRWNRPCYGILDGRPHLRIENRVLPAGPSVPDEVANAAFWFGLVRGVADQYGDIAQVMDFGDANENFTAAARLGLAANLTWPGLGQVPATELVARELLPVARRGLETLGFDSRDAERYLGIVEDRVRCGRTGSMWLLDSLAGMQGQGTRPERLAALTAAARNRQAEGAPVATWELARIEEAGGPRSDHLRVGQLMTTDLFTVGEHDLVDLVAYVMTWRHIRHVPVEDAHHRLVGIVTHRALLRLIGEGLSMGQGSSIPVERIMERDVVTVTSETTVLAAMRQMKEHQVSGLPVVDAEGRLVGMITERDLMQFAGQLLEQALAGEPLDPTALAAVGAPASLTEEPGDPDATVEREATTEEREAGEPTSSGPREHQ